MVSMKLTSYAFYMALCTRLISTYSLSCRTTSTFSTLQSGDPTYTAVESSTMEDNKSNPDWLYIKQIHCVDFIVSGSVSILEDPAVRCNHAARTSLIFFLLGHRG